MTTTFIKILKHTNAKHEQVFTFQELSSQTFLVAQIDRYVIDAKNKFPTNVDFMSFSTRVDALLMLFALAI